MKKRSILFLSTIGLLSTGIVLAATNKDAEKVIESKKEEAYKRYEVIHFQNGEAVMVDTLIPMSSSYSVDDFLKDHNIQSETVEVIEIPYGSGPQEMKEEHVVMVKKSEESTTSGNGKEEKVVEINVEDDGNGNIKATKTVNGKTVELTPEELEEIEIMHQNAGENGEKEIVLDFNIEELDSMSGEISKIIKSIDLSVDDINIDMDSLMEAVMKEVNIDIDTDGKKVIVKSFISSDGETPDEEQVVIMHGDEEYNWKSEDGKSIVKIASTGDEEDMTIVLVTENIPANKPSKKSAMIETPEAEFTIYPNPSTGQFKLEFEQDKKAPTKLQIVDLSGKTVYSEDLGQFKGRYNNTIDLSKFGKGIYTIYILNEDTPTTGRVIIQ